jgi:hypothetical protein
MSSHKFTINLVSEINPEIWSRQISSDLALKLPNLLITHAPIWADLYIFYNTNKFYGVPNNSAQRIFYSSEPVSLRRDSNLYLNQFDQVLGSVSSLFPNRGKFEVKIPASPWHIGVNFENAYGKINLDFSELSNLGAPYIDEVSVITSNKNISKTHQKRLFFIEELSRLLGAKIKIFGRGVNPIEDKYEVLSKYRYHIALENTKQRDHWSEKLADPIIALNRVYYFGCSNIENYFHPSSVLPIDIDDPVKVSEIILDEIKNNYWESSQKAMKLSKIKILSEYNLINIISNLPISESDKEHKFPVFGDIFSLPRKIWRKSLWSIRKFIDFKW